MQNTKYKITRPLRCLVMISILNKYCFNANAIEAFCCCIQIDALLALLLVAKICVANTCHH